MITKRIKLKTVSVIVPTYNEEKYIEKLIDSLLIQDYDFKYIEVIFIDGNSKDNTINIIKRKMNNKNVTYKILNNKNRVTPISLNMGIKESSNDIIIRIDAHSEYPKNYITKCVYYINNIDAENVGCVIKTVSKGLIGEAISKVLSSKFGVGNSKFRTNSKSGYVDTVPFGTFRKELFNKIGYFDERLIRNQDSEFNHRILKNGGKIYLFNDIEVIYHPRDNICKLIKMALLNGKWNLYTMHIVPGSMKLRHFIPFIFVISLILGLIGFINNIYILKIIFLLELIVYFSLDIIYSFKGIKVRELKKIILCLLIYPIFHISYGIGTFSGIILIIKKRK